MSVLEVVSSNPVGAAARTPPHNLEAEKSVLGSVFIKPAAFDEVATSLRDGRLLPARPPRDLRRDGGDRQAPPGDRRHRRRRRAEDARHAGAPRRRRRATSTIWPTPCRRRRTSLHYARMVREKSTLRRLIATCAEVQSTRLRRLRRVRDLPRRGRDQDLQGRPAEPARDLLLHRRHDGGGAAQPRGAHRRAARGDGRADRLHQAGRATRRACSART